MKEIKIFIASSNEVKEERDIIERFINEESNKYHDFNLHIKPEMWELESREFELPKKQDSYNQKLMNSDIVIFMFGTRVGKYTKQEFDFACKNYASHGHPKHILAYFKNQHIESNTLNKASLEDLEGIVALKDYIANNLYQVYDTFFGKYDLQLKIANELNLIVRPIIFSDNKNFNSDSSLERLIDLYFKITQNFQLNERNKIIENAINGLHFLYTYNLPLSGKDFYNMCKMLIGTVNSGDAIKAISVMLKCEWDGSPEEVAFWKANIDAVNRQVMLERIFIVKKDEAHRLTKIPQILNHIHNQGTHLIPYVIEKEYLEEKAPSLLKEIGDGFLLFDKTALLDSDPVTGSRGIVITDEKKLLSLHELFETLKSYTKPLNEYVESIKMSHVKKEMISIFVTTKCNLNCIYCFTNKYEDTHKSQTIALDFVKAGIDDYFMSNGLVKKNAV